MALVLRLRRCGGCGHLFTICRRCDRGQAYCGPPCRQTSRRRIVRAAGTRHQRSPEGRLDHRDYMRGWRAQRRRVTHPGSPAGAPAGRVAADAPPPPIPGAPAARLEDPHGLVDDVPRPAVPAPAAARPDLARCRRCGRVGTWIAHGLGARRARPRTGAP